MPSGCGAGTMHAAPADTTEAGAGASAATARLLGTRGRPWRWPRAAGATARERALEDIGPYEIPPDGHGAGRSDQQQRRLLDAPGRHRLGSRRRHRLPRRAGRPGRRRRRRRARHAAGARARRHPRQPRAVRPHAHARRSARPRRSDLGVDRRARPARGAAPRRPPQRPDRHDLLRLSRRHRSGRRPRRARAAGHALRLWAVAGDVGAAVRRRARGGGATRARISARPRRARAPAVRGAGAAGPDRRVRAGRHRARLPLGALRGHEARAAGDPRHRQSDQRPARVRHRRVCSCRTGRDQRTATGPGSTGCSRSRAAGRRAATEQPRRHAGGVRPAGEPTARRRGARCCSTCATWARCGLQQDSFPGLLWADAIYGHTELDAARARGHPADVRRQPTCARCWPTRRRPQALPRPPVTDAAAVARGRALFSDRIVGVIANRQILKSGPRAYAAAHLGGPILAPIDASQPLDAKLSVRCADCHNAAPLDRVVPLAANPPPLGRCIHCHLTHPEPPGYASWASIAALSRAGRRAGRARVLRALPHRAPRLRPVRGDVEPPVPVRRRRRRQRAGRRGRRRARRRHRHRAAAGVRRAPPRSPDGRFGIDVPLIGDPVHAGPIRPGADRRRLGAHGAARGGVRDRALSAQRIGADIARVAGAGVAVGR